MSLLAKISSKIGRFVTVFRRKRQARKQGISFLRPNYIFFGDLDASSLAIDVGCGYEAELALHLIEAYGCRAVGVDPTRKHAPALARLQEQTNGRFRHLPCAVAAAEGTLTFHESTENESGSLLENHTNVLHDAVRSYEVEALTLGRLLETIGVETADFLKLDLEGAEYELLRAVDAEALSRFRQVFVEFHHHCIASRTVHDTEAVVASLHALGLASFSLDGHNYLFFWPEAVRSAPRARPASAPRPA